MTVRKYASISTMLSVATLAASRLSRGVPKKSAIASDHRLSFASSSRGSPSSSPMTLTGSGDARSAIASIWGRSRSASTRSRASASTRPVRASTRRGERALDTSPRRRVWAGGSISSDQELRLRMRGWSRSSTSGGSARVYPVARLADSAGERNPAITSAWRVTIHAPQNGLNTGPAAILDGNLLNVNVDVDLDASALRAGRDQVVLGELGTVAHDDVLGEEDLRLRVGQILADRRDFAIRNQNIRHFVHTVGRVNHTAAANQQLFHQTFSLLVSI